MFIVQKPDLSESAPMTREALQNALTEGSISSTTLVRDVASTQWTSVEAILAAPAPSSRPAPNIPDLPTPRVSKLAVASMICGILTLPTCGLSGIAAIICGVIALVKLGKNKATLKGQGFAIAGIVMGSLCVLMIPIGAGLMLPALAKAKSRAQTINCMNQMKQVCLGLRIHAEDHKQTFPMDLKTLSPELSSPRLLICPGDTKPISEEAKVDWNVLRTEDISYEFVTPGLDVSKSNPQRVILRCPIHGNEGLEDGSVHMAPRGDGRFR